METKSILVTGSHRSGTTWMGRMLALSSKLTYVHEPLNVDYSHELLPTALSRWYEYIPFHEEAEQHRHVLERVLELRYPFMHHLRSARTPRDMYNSIRSAGRYWVHRYRNTAVLLKDPMALLQAEWLNKQFDIDVLVMIRHPAAFAGSLKEKGWSHPFEDFLAQPRLMTDHFSAYADEIAKFARTEQDIVDQAALLWTLLYSVVSTYRKRNPEWTFVRHEDVARDPVDTFRLLYGQQDLSFTKEIRSEIEDHSYPSSESSENSPIRRESQSVVRNWTRRLTKEEIRRIRVRTEPIASKFYTDDDW